MTRSRALKKLELTPATNGGQEGWVAADWRRADGSKGRVFVRLHPNRAASRYYIVRMQIDEPTAALLRDVPQARIEAAANADPEIRAWMERGLTEPLATIEQRIRARRVRLKRPAKHRLDDDFYERVAAAYRDAVAHGLPPAKTLAEDSDTPPGTVNRWIAKAREDGHLPKGQRGKVTA